MPAPPSIQKPLQKRAIATRERLIAATGHLLEEVGVDRISTNLIAERAGVSPPALYNYFPDKYAIFRVLGERLMEAQNALVALEPNQSDEAIGAMLIATVDLTQSFPGGVWVTRMLRAVPALDEVRRASHAALCDDLTEQLAKINQGVSLTRAATLTRLCIDLGYAAVELALDEPHLDRGTIMLASAKAINAVLADLIVAA